MPTQGLFFFSFFLLQPFMLIAASHDLFFTLDGSHQISEFMFDQCLVFMSHFFFWSFMAVFLRLLEAEDKVLQEEKISSFACVFLLNV